MKKSDYPCAVWRSVHSSCLLRYVSGHYAEWWYVTEGFVLNTDGNVAEIRCVGPGAWHPLDPSWVPLPVPRRR